MAYQLTLTAKSLASQISIKPNLIVEIEGVDLVLGYSPILEAARWDNNINWDQEGVFWDGLVEKIESREYLSLRKTSKDLRQQILVDKGGSSSATTMNVQIINKDNEISKATSFDKIGDILGKKASVFLNFADGSHPEDSVPIFRGYIDDYQDDVTSLIFSISSSENLKRQTILEKYNSTITQKIKYKDLDIQDLTISQRNKQDPVYSIEYLTGGALSSVVLGSFITVTLNTGSTTASQLLTELRTNPNINAVIEGEISGNESSVQAPQAVSQFSIDTTINVESTINIIESSDALTTYVQVNDEIMEVVSVDSSTQLSVNRTELGSFGSSHDDEDDIGSIYRLQGFPTDLALKLMLSEEGNEFYDTTHVIEAFRIVNVDTNIAGAIIFSDFDIEDSTGLTEGDTIKVTGSASNDGEYLVDSFFRLEDGRSGIIVKDEKLVTEIETVPVFSYLSKYGLLPFGLGMQPGEVDVASFEEISDLFSSNFVEYDFFIKDTIEEAKDFIDKQIFFPQGLYAVHRKARSSVRFTSPPLSVEDIPLLDINTVIGMQNVTQKRSTHKYFYNNVVYRYSKDVFDDEFKRSQITIDNESTARIKVGNKSFRVEADGLTRTAATDAIVSRISNRLLDRYKFAAKFMDVQVLYKVGYSLEIGDVLTFGGENVKLNDPQTGDKNLPIELYEVINKTMSVQTGKILLTLLQTGFSTSGRFGVISPSSLVGVNSSNTRINLEKFLDIGEYNFEGEKWKPWEGAKILVRSEDWSVCAEVDLLQVPDNDSSALVVSDIGFSPTDGMIIELADYDSQPSNGVGDQLKLKYVFLMEHTTVTAQIDAQSFEASVGGLIEGQSVLIHNDDYSDDSIETKILTIVGSIITLEDSLSFVPGVSYTVQTLDFASDGGDGYRFL